MYSKFRRIIIKNNAEETEYIYYKGDFSKMNIDYDNDWRFKEVKNKRKN